MFTAILGTVGTLAAAGIAASASSSSSKKANQTNEKIAEQNLAYQRERNAIEDARYAEETAYNREFAEDERAHNRAFAENEREYQRAWAQDEREYQRAWAQDEREYNRALQDEIFAREDTSYQRSVEDMSKAGLNPLSMSGTDGSGSVVSSTSAPSASAPSASAPSVSAPSASARGGQALRKDFTYQKEESAQFLNALVTEIPHLCENFYKLDSLRQQAIGEKIKNMRNVAENQKFFVDNGISFNGSQHFNWNNYDKGIWKYDDSWNANNLHKMNRNQLELYNQYLDTFNKKRNTDFDVQNGLFASTSSLERTLTGISNVLTNGKLDEFTKATHDKNGNFDVGKAMRFLLLGAMNNGISGFKFN